MPSGIRFSNGAFSGKPTESGDFEITITASNDVAKDSKNFTLTVIDPNAPKVTTQKINNASKEILRSKEEMKSQEFYPINKRVSRINNYLR